MPNRLINESSPYLLQHAHNPVDWYPWGDEALERARKEDKPIFLSIGYSACHWCHVMERECFQDVTIAHLMNEHFMCIKVDREERPDIDHIYMEAVQAMTASGGWPLTVFLTPEGKPFHGGTYFPPEDRYNMPGLPRVIKAVTEAYYHHRNDIEQAAKQIVTALTSNTKIDAIGELLVADILKQAYEGMNRKFDKENGGFGTTPKFPQPMTLEFVLRYFHCSQNADALKMADLTLEKMAKGGIYDQIGGGFHRYATDRHWLVPHFEKMLYDNALLSQVYLHAYLVTGKTLFRSIVEETLDYVLREMTDPQGGFYSTQDADSEGMEGKYYLWMPWEITEVVGEKPGQLVNDYFGVTTRGNFNGRNILHVVDDYREETLSLIGRAKLSLLRRREHRVKPGRDEKVLASWNGLMLVSLAEAACALDRQDYLATAIANGSFLLNSMITDGYLKHTYKDGKTNIDGYLQDYALVIDGLLALHQATFAGEWLRQAIRLSEVMIEQFWNEATGTLYDVSRSHQDLFVRPKNMLDGALPSGASAATLTLLRLARLIDNERFEQIAVCSLQSVRESMVQQPLGFNNWLCALDFYLSQPEEIVIIGARHKPATLELLRTLCTTWLPNKVVAAYDPNDPTAVSGLKLIENRQMINNQPTVYVCRQHICQTPVTDPSSLGVQLTHV